MRIIQMLTTVSYGDAVSNDAIAINDTLKKYGYSTGLYAENIDPRLPKKLATKIEAVPKLEKEDVILYHLSTGTDLNYKLSEYKGRKVIIYHNVTPNHFFKNYNENTRRLCAEGEKGLKYLAEYADYGLAVSEYNRQGMIEAGYTCKVDVLPILIPFDDYKKTPNKKVMQKYFGTEYTNILFTGRLAPNKKQDDVIRAFYMYKKYYNPKARLFIVGSYSGMEKYYRRLKEYVKELQLKDVFFTGHIKFDEILAYYHIADYFLCMSEHEGFCVPLVEAMLFQVPIIAYDSSAIGETLGGSGFLLKDKNPLQTAGVLDYLDRHPKVREQMIQDQMRRLQDFDHDHIEKQFVEYLEKFVEENK